MTASTKKPNSEETLTVCGIDTKPGEKSYGWVEITQVWNGAYRIPLVVANGSRPGKTLLLLGMQHGDEYDGFDVAHQVMARIDPGEMSGAVICVPCVNVPAFVSGARTSFMDGVDMNRVHPGKPAGFFTEQIAFRLDSEILPLADAVIDLHGGNLDLEVLPYVGLVMSDEQSMAMARATGVNNLYAIDENRMERTLLVATRELGIPHINLEFGGGVWGRPELVRDMTAGIENVLRLLEILPGDVQPPAGSIYLRRSRMLGPTTGGFWRPTAKIGDRVREGDELGTVVNLLNETLETLTAPADGFIQDFRSWPKVWPGDWTVLLGVDEQVLD